MFWLIFSLIGFIAVILTVIIVIIGYVISSLGYYMLFMKLGYKTPLVAWIPYYGEALFLQKELRLPELLKWILTFYFVLTFIPTMGDVVSVLGYLSVAGLSCWYIYRRSGSVAEYICAFLLRPVLPYFWLKDNGNPTIID